MKAIVVSDLHHKDKQWLESLQADSDVDLVAVAGDIDINVRRVPHHNRLAAELRKIYPNAVLVLVPGNHDKIYDLMKMGPWDHILNDGEIQVKGRRIYGCRYWDSPFIAYYKAIYTQGHVGFEKAKEIFERIPEGLDLLITHVPPYGILDSVFDGHCYYSMGSLALKDRLHAMREGPRWHVFGHMHQDGGKCLQKARTVYANVAYLDEDYLPRKNYKPLEIVL